MYSDVYGFADWMRSYYSMYRKILSKIQTALVVVISSADKSWTELLEAADCEIHHGFIISSYLMRGWSELTTCTRLHSGTHLAPSGLTLATGVPYSCTNGVGASNMNIHYDITGLLTVVWRTHSGQIVWAVWVGQGGGGFCTHSTYAWYQGVCQLDRWRCLVPCSQRTPHVCSMI